MPGTVATQERITLKGRNKLHVLYLCFVLATAALVRIGLEVSNGNQTTQVADVHFVGIWGCIQTLVQELGSSVCYLTVTLHFTETKTSITMGNQSIDHIKCSAQRYDPRWNHAQHTTQPELISVVPLIQLLRNKTELCCLQYLQSGISNGCYLMCIIAVISSVIAGAYYVRLVQIIHFQADYPTCILIWQKLLRPQIPGRDQT